MSVKQEDVFDFKREFLDYLSKNKMEYYEIFDETVSEYSFFEKQLIQEISEMVEVLIDKMSEGRGISPEVHVFCMQDELVNAFCFTTNQHYYIGINSATYVELIRRTQILSEYLVEKEQWGYYQNKSAEEVQALLWMYAFKMILAHEYMHIILGHCDTICSEKAFLWEVNLSEKSESSQSFSIKELQAMELFADEFAAKDATWQILSGTERIEEIKYKLLNYYLAVLLVFSIFHNYRGKEETHPKLGIRLHSIMATVDDTVIKGLDASDWEMQIEKIDTVIDTFMDIVQEFPRLFSYDIVTELGVNDFDKEYLELYNVASDIVKITNQRAVYPINEFKKMDEKTLELLDKEREILFYATQMGMSYDDACAIIRKME